MTGPDEVRETHNVPETPSLGVSGKCPDVSSGGQNPGDEPGPREKIAEGALLLVEAAKAFERRDFVAGAVLTALSTDAMCDGAARLMPSRIVAGWDPGSGPPQTAVTVERPGLNPVSVSYAEALAAHALHIGVDVEYLTEEDKRDGLQIATLAAIRERTGGEP